MGVLKIKISKVEISEANDLTELTLRSKSYWNYGEQQIEAWREELTISEKYISENQLYKLEKENQLIGFYAYHAINERDIKLNFLFVEPKYIGMGYGKLLMIDFMQRMEKSDFRRVFLDADPNAAQFYEKLGFHIIGKLKSTIKDRFLPIMEFSINQS